MVSLNPQSVTPAIAGYFAWGCFRLFCRTAPIASGPIPDLIPLWAVMRGPRVSAKPNDGRSDVRVAIRADGGNPHHVGGAGDAERHAGDDDHALAGADKAIAERDLAGPAHHVVLVARVFRHHAMHAPHDGEPA